MLFDDKVENDVLYKLNFDAKNLSSGIYFYKIEAGEFFDLKKMILLK